MKGEKAIANTSKKPRLVTGACGMFPGKSFHKK
jgi:hypothetical protein